VPRWWRYPAALRGLINPLLDRRMERDARTRALVADLDADALGGEAAEMPLNAAG
jgi:hypothetical protein